MSILDIDDKLDDCDVVKHIVKKFIKMYGGHSSIRKTLPIHYKWDDVDIIIDLDPLFNFSYRSAYKIFHTELDKSHMSILITTFPIKYTEKDELYRRFSPYLIKEDDGGWTNLTLEHIID
jgi:hypothetical protein